MARRVRVPNATQARAEDAKSVDTKGLEVGSTINLASNNTFVGLRPTVVS